MHISLDSALGRQRRLNQIGETISSIAAPTAAYSLRSITGGDPKAVRVRRSSDDSEQDFTVSEVFSGALVNFVGSGNDGFVETWYDQLGSSNVTQSTSTKQPKIVNAGALLKDANGNSYLEFDGTDDFYNISKTTFRNVSYGYASAVAQYDDTNATNEPVYYASNGVSGSSSRAFLGKLNSGGAAKFVAAGRRTDSDAFRSSLETADTNKNLLTGLFQWGDGEVQLFVNGAAKTAASFLSGAGATSDTDSNTAFIGRFGSSYYDGKIYELIVYNTDQSGNRQALETNIANEYNITLS